MLAKSREADAYATVTTAPAVPARRFGARTAGQSSAATATRRSGVSHLPSLVRLVAETCLEELPGRYRDVIRLGDVDGLPAADVATRLAIPVELVAARLDRARRLLAVALCRRFRAGA